MLGPFKVGDNSKIGAGAVVIEEVPPNCTVVGIPGHIVKRNNVLVNDMDQIDLPDPVETQISCLRDRIAALEAELNMYHKKELENCSECDSDGCMTCVPDLEALLNRTDNKEKDKEK